MSRALRRDIYLMEAKITQRHMSNLREVGFTRSNQFPLHPQDRQKNVDNNFGVNPSFTPFSPSRHPVSYEHQSTIPLSNYNPGLSPLEKAGLAIGGGIVAAGVGTVAAGVGSVGAYVASGAAKGIYDHARRGHNIRKGLDVFSTRSAKGQDIGLFHKHLLYGTNKIKGRTFSQLKKLARRRSTLKGSYLGAAYRGVGKAIMHPIKHLKSISGWNKLNRV